MKVRAVGLVLENGSQLKRSSQMKHEDVNFIIYGTIISRKMNARRNNSFVPSMRAVKFEKKINK
jgi:hypothetical protein